MHNAINAASLTQQSGVSILYVSLAPPSLSAPAHVHCITPANEFHNIGNVFGLDVVDGAIANEEQS